MTEIKYVAIIFQRGLQKFTVFTNSSSGEVIYSCLFICALPQSKIPLPHARE